MWAPIETRIDTSKKENSENLELDPKPKNVTHGVSVVHVLCCFMEKIKDSLCVRTSHGFTPTSYSLTLLLDLTKKKPYCLRVICNLSVIY